MVANTPPSAEELNNAGTDLDTLDKVVNGPEDLGGTGLVKTRRGGAIQTLAKILAGAANVAQTVQDAYDELADRVEDVAAVRQALEPGGVLEQILAQLSDLELVNARLDEFENSAVGLDIAAIAAEVRRLATHHPAVPPAWLPIPTQVRAAGDDGVLVDLSKFVRDTDTALEDLRFSVGGLPEGVVLDGSLIQTSGAGIIPLMAVSVTVVDPSGKQAATVLNFEVYDPASPPIVVSDEPPVWAPLTALFGTVGQALAPFNYGSFLSHADGDLSEVSLTLASPVPGLRVVGLQLLGTPEAVGAFTLEITARHANGEIAIATQQLTVLQVFTGLPNFNFGGGGGGGEFQISLF
jgi:hypothetical protein